MVLVIFTQDDAPFRLGELKECTAGEAEKLIRNGVAAPASELVADSVATEAGPELELAQADKPAARRPRGRH